MGLFDALFGKKNKPEPRHRPDPKQKVSVEHLDAYGNRQVCEFDAESEIGQMIIRRKAIEAEFDRRMDELNRANESLAAGDDAEHSLDVMWRILVDEYDVCVGWSNVWYDRFARHLVKHGQNDRAWEMLNFITEKRPNPDDLWHIRDIQCAILKKEGRYKAAMSFLMCKFFLRGLCCAGYESERFFKEAKPIANKLKLDAKQVEYLSYLIETALKRGARDECFVIDAYDRAIAEFGL